MKHPTGSIDYGRLSGYPPCCIAWFFIRWQMVVRIPGYYKALQPYNNYMHRNFGTQHVSCPVHQAILHVTRKRLEYFSCKECGWKQLGKGPCRIEPLHETWVVQEIERSYLRQMAERGKIYYRQPGRIAKEMELLIQYGRE